MCADRVGAHLLTTDEVLATREVLRDGERELIAGWKGWQPSATNSAAPVSTTSKLPHGTELADWGYIAYVNSLSRGNTSAPFS